MMARSDAAPFKGRIQMRKTNPLHLFTFGLQRTAGQSLASERLKSTPFRTFDERVRDPHS